MTGGDKQGKGVSDIEQQIDTHSQLSVAHKFTNERLHTLINVVNKVSNRTGPSRVPWGAPLLTGHQLDAAPFTSTLWAWLYRQFLTQHRVFLSNPWAASFSRECCGRQCQRPCWSPATQHPQPSQHPPGKSLGHKRRSGWSNTTYPS